jgi:hypothetical protein
MRGQIKLNKQNNTLQTTRIHHRQKFDNKFRQIAVLLAFLNLNQVI